MTDYWDPEEDGITHINVYSKGATELGRWLTNFSKSPFTHPEYGTFQSMEGYWYWLSTGMKHPEFHTLVGWKAKELGKTLAVVECDDFIPRIKTGIRAKLLAHPHMLRQLIDNPLPLTHYYVYGGKAVHAGYEWITEYYEEVRQACIDKHYRP